MNHEKDNTAEKAQVGTIYDDVYRTLTVSCSRLSSYEYNMIIDMSKKVLEGIAARYENVRKGVKEVFGGKIIETDTLKAYWAYELNSKKETALRMRDLGMKEADIAYALRVSISTVEEWLDPVPA